MLEKFFKKRRAQKGIEIEDSIMTVTQKEKAIIELPFKRRGLSLFWLGIMLALIGLWGRVFYLEYFRGAYYAKVARSNRIRSIIIKAPRGIIVDKYGKILAKNIPSLDAVVIPGDLPQSSVVKKNIADKLSELLKMNSGKLRIILENQDTKSFNPVLIKKNITQDQALIIVARADEFPGIFIEKTAIRAYENGTIFAPIIGYDGKITTQELKKEVGYSLTDYIGKTGLEKEYEKELKGVNGANQVEIDSLGRVKKKLEAIKPQCGDELILNIDEALQKKIYDSLQEILEKTKTKMASAVAIDPRNGGVLAMVSIPSYDNNLFAQGITIHDFQSLINNKNLPLLNRCIAGEYPPGSTIKPAIAIAGLAEKVINPQTIINGLGGVLNIGSYHFRDWRAHAPSDVRLAIAQSNDVFFYTVGGGYGNIQGLGMDRMKKYENLLGLGVPSGIDLPGEAKGLIPSKEWKKQKIGERWYVGDSYHAAIGQGYVTATPLQMANLVATVANGGTLYSPRIVNRIKKNNGQEKIITPKIIRSDFIQPNIIKVVQEGMRMTVTSGTAQILKNLPIPIAGKTGTAQFGTQGKTHSWFTAFAPYNKPTIAIAVLVEGGGEGNSAALPVVKNVLEWYFQYRSE